jgi:hypothetical protein
MPTISPSKIPTWLKEKLAEAGSLDYCRHYSTLVKQKAFHPSHTSEKDRRLVQDALDQLKKNKPDEFRNWRNQPYEIDGTGLGALWYDPGTDSRFIWVTSDRARGPKKKMEKCYCTTDAHVRGYRLFALSGWSAGPFAFFSDQNNVLWVQHTFSDESSPIAPETLDEFRYIVSTLQRRWNQQRGKSSS